MDFSSAPKLPGSSAGGQVPRSDIVATQGSVAVTLPPEQTVQSASAGDAVKLDIRAQDRRAQDRSAQDRSALARDAQDRAEARQRGDASREEAARREAETTEIVERRLVIEPRTRTVVLEKTNQETGETIETLPDEATLRLRLMARAVEERAREISEAAGRHLERTA